MVVFVMIGIALLMSFMILVNLTSIYISRKKKEIIIMRINGFTLRQTDHYLIRETIFTAASGLLIALIAGMLLTDPVLRLLEQPDVMFVRAPSVILWGLAVLIQGAFALLINLVAFRKTRTFKLREISES